MKFSLTYTLLASMLATHGWAQEKAPAIEKKAAVKQLSFAVSGLQLDYDREKTGLEEADILSSEVFLGTVSKGTWQLDKKAEAQSIASFFTNNANARLTPSAVRELTRAIVKVFNDEGIVGVYAVPSPQDINRKGKDLRKKGNSLLTVKVWTSKVAQVRTLSLGADSSELTVNKKFNRIHEESPLVEGSLLRRDELEDYVTSLNRHPGRRVEMAVSSAEKKGEVVLDYLINQGRSWTLYYLLENTGTGATSEWRNRVGYSDYQFTNNDDIFSIDYSRADFLKLNTPSENISASYDAPITSKLRYKVGAGFSRYTASDIGVNDDTYEGKTYTAFAELSYNVLQYGGFFTDVYAGIRYQRIETKTPFDEPEGHVVPAYVGLRLEHRKEMSQFSAYAAYEWQLPFLQDDSETLERLGRFEPDGRYKLITYGMNYNRYLDSLYGDEKGKTHKASFSFNGQRSLGDRLIPQLQSIEGGAYTVRGYEESEAVGDNTYNCSLEYNLNLLEYFRDPTEKANDTWDVYFRTFGDYGRVSNRHAESYELSQELWSYGLGVEAAYTRDSDDNWPKQYVGRVDMAWAGKDIEVAPGEDEATQAGDYRIHFTLTILF